VRCVFVGASELTAMTASRLADRGHQVVIVESERDRIDALSDELDCSFLHGDGSQPAVLREADPEGSDILFCLTDDDPINILASLVGRSLGFPRVVTSIVNTEYETLCEELGLEDTIVPIRTISRYLADLASGLDVLELRTAIRGDARVFSFTAGESAAGTVADLDLPEQARVICLYGENDEFQLADEETTIAEGNEVVILTHQRHLADLRERWDPETGDADEG